MRADLLNEWASTQGLYFTAEQIEQFERFQEKLLAVNTYMNLTAITDDADIAVKHFIDSLTVLPWIGAESRVIDIGAGAGFPGVPVKIARPALRLTLLDSLRKRIFFLQEIAEMLAFTDVTCLHARAEELSRKPAYCAQYDIAMARAVARLDLLAGYALPFLRQGGLFLAMKGPEVSEELSAAKKALAKSGGAVAEVKPVVIAPGLTHTVVVIEKR